MWQLAADKSEPVGDASLGILDEEHLNLQGPVKLNPATKCVETKQIHYSIKDLVMMVKRVVIVLCVVVVIDQWVTTDDQLQSVPGLCDQGTARQQSKSLDPVVGSEARSVSWPVRSDHVDINSFLQEAVGHAEAKVVDLWILYHSYLQETTQGWEIDLESIG
ncbi:hypothetical protein F7725_017530 [Dissostichus mawsoni]|uniref:Uncharacterized protein n=1 Tax=Dissostichus mawsoni TaxID=36200 RepID=A0A7J5Z7V8_DISMA|nr:hypothetical protein F7725_017530 [Dissostichus mawsoni]